MPPTEPSGAGADPLTSADTGPGGCPDVVPHAGRAEDDTLDLTWRADVRALLPVVDEVPEATGAPDQGGTAAGGDLLDRLPRWGPVTTDRGSFQLFPVVLARDLPLVAYWMNDPAVAEYWGLAGPDEITERHLATQLKGDGRSAPCLGVLEGRPMSYWEIYRADLDPLARYYPARPHDTGIHLLIGTIAERGHGLGAVLLRATADHILDHRPACARVVAEPDLRNTASVAAFLAAGFRFAAEIDLPDKRAALMVREHRLRALL